MLNIRKISKLIYKATLLVAMLLVLSAQQLNAQQITANASLDTAFIAIGGQANLKLELSKPVNMNILFPALKDTINKNIEIVEIGKADTLKVGTDREVISRNYIITSFDTGLFYINPLEFQIIQGDTKDYVKSNALSLNVLNPFKEVNPEKGIADIKAPIDTPFIFRELLPYVYAIGGGLIIVALLVFLIIWYIRKRKNKPEPEVIIPVEAAHIVALRKLDNIKAAKLWENNKIKEYYTQVSDTVRDYIENRYKISALEQTSDEIFDSMRSLTNVNKNTMGELTQILQLSDLVKFAKYTPYLDDNKKTIDNAYSFVNETKLEEKEVSEEEKTTKQDDVTKKENNNE